MSRKQRGGKGRGPGVAAGPQGQQGTQQPRPAGVAVGGTGAPAGGWGALRDAVRREIEQAGSSLAFAERLHSRLDTQRRLFTDFPRVMEQLRSGALERVSGSLARLYVGGQGFDLTRFLPEGDQLKSDGDLTAWRATLPENERDLAALSHLLYFANGITAVVPSGCYFRSCTHWTAIMDLASRSGCANSASQLRSTISMCSCSSTSPPPRPVRSLTSA